ncbi:MAG: hypothetical protein N3A54_06195, partial [Patescibacteria group bacterium]|nr:hypothetical protein [Patescibacteria group bacterium]
GLLDLAEKYSLVKKVGNKYTFPDGKSAFERVVYKNPEEFFTDNFLERLEECANKEFFYGDNTLSPEEDGEEE